MADGLDLDPVFLPRTLARAMRANTPWQTSSPGKTEEPSAATRTSNLAVMKSSRLTVNFLGSSSGKVGCWFY